MKALINSIKHIVQESLAVINEQTMRNIIIARATAQQPTTSILVAVGANIKAIYLEYWLLGESAQPCTATWTFEKTVNDAVAMTQSQGQDMFNYPNKRNILKSGQGVIGDSNTNPIPIIREWIKIPKGKQRMAVGDEWVFNVSCIGETDNGLEVCGLAIYKEYQ